MTEFVLFLLDLALVAGAGLVALVAAWRSVPRAVTGVFAAGAYGLGVAAVLFLVPPLAWERARTDNAFLGLYPLALLVLLFAVGTIVISLPRIVRAPAGRWPVGAVPAAVIGAAALCGLVLVRGPGAWQTGSGEFGLDVVVAAVVVGILIFAFTAWLGAGRTAKP